MSTSPRAEDGRLGFAAATRKAFAFLTRRGFEVVRDEGTLVRFERRRLLFKGREVFFNVYQGRSSYELGVEIGRLRVKETYGLGDVLGTFAPRQVEQARWQPTTAEAVERCLAAIAETMQASCMPLFDGDAEAYRQLRSAVEPARRALTLMDQYGAVIDRGDAAWEAKDYEAAARWYEEASEALDETRQRRLKYLKSRAGRS